MSLDTDKAPHLLAVRCLRSHWYSEYYIRCTSISIRQFRNFSDALVCT